MALAAALLLVGGPAWATSQTLPPASALAAAPEPGSPAVEIPQATPVLPQPWELSPAPRPPAPAPTWQTFVLYREVLRWGGGVVLALVVALGLVHLAFHGFHHLRRTGTRVRRYPVVEVVLHAILAVAFLAAWGSSTYLILAKYALGYAEQGAPVPLGQTASTVHVTAGLLFLGALGALAHRWRPAMRFAPYDVAWLKALGGYFSRPGGILPAGRFNAGQKVWFRIVVPTGILVSVSGALLYYPGWLGVGWGIALYVAHTALAVFASAAVIGHVYLAAVAHPHALQGMITGEVDEACLREDYPLAARPEVAASRDAA
jgi:formate dehydrogenase subunit gamma